MNILRLICQGRPNKIISYELSIAEATVKTHIAAIMAKINVSNRTQAALLASKARIFAADGGGEGAMACAARPAGAAGAAAGAWRRAAARRSPPPRSPRSSATSARRWCWCSRPRASMLAPITGLLREASGRDAG